MLSPGLLARSAPLVTAADLAGYTLLHEENRDGWSRWFEAAGVGSATAQRGPIFQDGALTTRAASLGHGVALGDLFLNDAELKSGELLQPFPISIPFGSYWLVAPDFDALSAPVRAFADWLLAEVTAEQTAD